MHNNALVDGASIATAIVTALLIGVLLTLSVVHRSVSWQKRSVYALLTLVVSPLFVWTLLAQTHISLSVFWADLANLEGSPRGTLYLLGGMYAFVSYGAAGLALVWCGWLVCDRPKAQPKPTFRDRLVKVIDFVASIDVSFGLYVPSQYGNKKGLPDYNGTTWR